MGGGGSKVPSHLVALVLRRLRDGEQIPADLANVLSTLVIITITQRRCNEDEDEDEVR